MCTWLKPPFQKKKKKKKRNPKKKSQIKILEMKSLISQMKSSVEILFGGLDQLETEYQGLKTR
jgi:hypothetical protein